MLNSMWSALIAAIYLAQTPIPPGAPNEVPPPDYSVALHQQLTSRSTAWLSQHKKVLAGLSGPVVTVVEIGVSRDGTARGIGLALSSGHNNADDLARAFILAAEPFGAPPAAALSENGEVTCLARIALTSRSCDPAVACFPPHKALPQVVGLNAAGRAATDPSARLFAGWTSEGQGDMKGALNQYRRANKTAPDWDYAARALGLGLVNDKRHAEAMPYLEVYLNRRAAPAEVIFLAREVKRFAKYQQEKEEWENRVREYLTKRDIAEGVKKGIPVLEPCLDEARDKRVLRLGSDTLLMSWKVKKDGTVYGVRLDGPSQVVLSAHADCLEHAVATWRFPKYKKGKDVAIKKWPIKVQGSSPPPPKAAPKPMSAELASATASVSQCMRGQQEIFTYIHSRFNSLNRCVQRERRAHPTLDYPRKLGLSFVVEPGGEVNQINVKHRFFKSGPFYECLVKALSGKLEPKGGTPCPAAFDLQL